MKRKFFHPFIPILFTMFFPLLLKAQENEVEMADMMRQNGKIYVVIAVVSVILIFFLIALINIDRKVRRMEKENRKD